ncbi:type II secretory pathway, component PulF [Idiomarina sp. A28L]|uniref:type II secretion system F family protein n=1 Tax=Idiomarina sp. A28L TaxID=1036674 RepID=UPI0002138799|nr:type II secretion system F family protein [Idiomarina sp. A28L]EGN74825.1 type II secretory pathway, component PulF [Idiomarina sp. A28L]
MAWFQWQGLHAELGPQKGIIQASTANLAKRQLYLQQIYVRSLSKLPSKIGVRHSRLFLPGFLFQWQSLLEAGFDQQLAWQHLHRNSQTEAQAEACVGVINALAQGSGIASAMARYPRLFSSEVCAWVEVGETTGRLPDVLQGMVATMEAERARQKQMRDALRYPLIVLSVAAITLLLMVFFLLPRFAAIYSQLDVTLPAVTQTLMQLETRAAQQKLLLVLGAIAGVVSFIQYRFKVWVRHPQHCRAIYRLPLVGQWLCQQHLLHDLDMLVLATESAIPLQQSCQLVSEHSASGYWQQQWQSASAGLSQGLTFSQTLAASNLPDLLLQAIAAGEQSGQLTRQLQFAMKQVTLTLDNQQQQVTQIVPTIVLILVSVVVLILLLALYLPLFQLGQTVR